MKKWVMMGMIVMVVFGLSGISSAVEKRGTAAEAETLVNRAVELLKTKGREAAYAEISRTGGQFVNRDLYVFVIDTQGNTLAHGFNKKLIGKNMLELAACGEFTRGPMVATLKRDRHFEIRPA